MVRWQVLFFVGPSSALSGLQCESVGPQDFLLASRVPLEVTALGEPQSPQLESAHHPLCSRADTGT